MDSAKLLSEEWREIPGSKSYQVSSEGRVRSLGRLLKLQVTRKGYHAVHLAYLNGRRRTASVHSLAMEAFVGPRPEGLVIAHRDGNRTNNRISNLRYCTAAENRADDIANGTRPRGERHGSSRLTAEKVREIRKRWSEGEASQRGMAGDYGVSGVTICHICTRRTWAHV